MSIFCYLFLAAVTCCYFVLNHLCFITILKKFAHEVVRSRFITSSNPFRGNLFSVSISIFDISETPRDWLNPKSPLLFLGEDLTKEGKYLLPPRFVWLYSHLSRFTGSNSLFATELLISKRSYSKLPAMELKYPLKIFFLPLK